jgi:sphinganine C4-monooxygenase
LIQYHGLKSPWHSSYSLSCIAIHVRMDMLREFPWAEHAKLFAGNFTLSKWELLHLIAPVIGFWALCLCYDILDNSTSPWVKQYRLKDAIRGNAVTKSHVVLRVMLQHIIQTSLGLTVLFFDPHMCQKPEKSWSRTCFDFALALFVYDAWMYWMHRLLHSSKFLYNNIHSTHHNLYAPYSYGALYNHPVEALLLDSVGGILTMYVSGMSCQATGWMYTVLTMKGVCDHSSYMYPLNPVYNLFANNARYHLLHHDLRGFKKNYAQPMFQHWDRIMGTYMHPDDLYNTSKKEKGSTVTVPSIAQTKTDTSAETADKKNT